MNVIDGDNKLMGLLRLEEKSYFEENHRPWQLALGKN